MIAFEPFNPFPWLVHGFTTRQKRVNVHALRTEVRAGLQKAHQHLLKSNDIEPGDLCLAEQVHENGVEVVDGVADPAKSFPGVDGLVTSHTNVPLGIYVADCCAIFLVETERHAIGLLHSGRKGTEANIAREGVRELETVSDGDPAKMIAVLSPCIHGCCYDVDFVSEIERQLKAERVGEVWQHPDCTGCHLDRYYSYRKEKGQTGRMLAFMMIRQVH